MTLEDFYIETKKLENYVVTTSTLQPPNFNKCLVDLYKKGLLDKDTASSIKSVWEYRNRYVSRGNKIENHTLPEDIVATLATLKERLGYE